MTFELYINITYTEQEVQERTLLSAYRAIIITSLLNALNLFCGSTRLNYGLASTLR